MAASIAELAVISEVQRQLDWHQPRLLPGVVSAADLESEYNKRAEFISIFDRIEADLYEVGMPLMKMRYPADRRRTAQTVARMREAENALDRFWEAADDYYARKTGKTLHELLSELLTPRQLERTPEWVEPIPPAPSKNEPHVDTSTISDQFSTIHFEEPSQKFYNAGPRKMKIKTRGPEAVSVPETQAHATTGETEDGSEAEPIPVSKRALQMFSILFRTDNQGLPGEIPWTEFLHGMSSAGFSIEKQYGSAWLFSPSDSAQRSILFHEPHPGNKIPIQVALRHSRRLRSAYGWTANTFVLR
jgi:hypothetical protein